jgi:hypothetical protein
MVHTNPEFETSNLILDFEFDQHLESRKHVINIIMWFRDMGCYKHHVLLQLRGEVNHEMILLLIIRVHLIQRILCQVVEQLQVVMHGPSTGEGRSK